jgi:hypothetical protein
LHPPATAPGCCGKIGEDREQLTGKTGKKGPNVCTLSKWLNRAVEHALTAREGTGRKADPFRFWLPAREEVWMQDPLYEIIERQQQELHLTFQSLRERRSAMGDDPNRWQRSKSHEPPGEDENL